MRSKTISAIFIISLISMLAINLAAAEDEYCFMKLGQGQRVNIGLANYYTCQHTSCTVCVDSASQWYAPWTRCQHTCASSQPQEPPLTLTANFPLQDNGFFTKQTFFLDISTSKIATIYLIDNIAGKQTTLCPNCASYQRSYTFKQGKNDITIRAVKGLEIVERSISFFIDNKPPRITKTLPSANSFSNGVFTAVYQEDNVKSIVLNYGAPGDIRQAELEGCESGKANCSIEIDLSSFDGQQITYNFTITDIANNVFSSKPIKIYVDKTAPRIASFNYNINKYYVTLNMSITEKNMKSVSYTDNGGISKILCSTLLKGSCIKKLYFKPGSHSLEIIVVDKAGNLVARQMDFIIV